MEKGAVLMVKVRSAPYIFDLAPNIPAPKKVHQAPTLERFGTKIHMIQHQIYPSKMYDLTTNSV